MGDDGFSEWLEGLAVEEGDGAVVVSTLEVSYSPPARNRTELDLSQLAAQYSREVLDLGVMVVRGALKLR